MKKCIVFLCFSFILAGPACVYADDPMFDSGPRMSGPEVIVNMGIWALTHPDAIKSSLADLNKEEEKKPTDADRKVDEAIKKAWGEN
jgi:hypothetical protein